MTCMVDEKALEPEWAAALVNARGRVQWFTPIQGEIFQVARTLLACEEGGFLVGGSLESASFYMRTAWVAKLSPAGDIEWTYAYDHDGEPIMDVCFTNR